MTSTTTTTSTSQDDRMLSILVEKATGIPRMDEGGTGKSDPYLTITLKGKKKKTKALNNKSDAKWNQKLEFDLSKDFDVNESLKEIIKIQMYDKDMFTKDDIIGTIEMALEDFVEREEHILFMTNPQDNIVIKSSRNTPMELHLSLPTIPSCWKKYQTNFAEEERKKFDKHVMVFSRGTRGDVQPFVALARGLATELNWCITIVTEIRWGSFVKRYKKLPKGRIRFRPSGGDTAARIDAPLAKWALGSTSELMQAAMLARAEGEFFASEPVFYRHAEIMRPDLILFGFTVANIAMIVSEKLRIPLIGFVLQPTCIPSEDYTAIIPISTHDVAAGLDKIEESFVSHGFQKFLKSMMDSNTIGAGLNKMRTKRALSPFEAEDSAWPQLVIQNIPIICPINPVTFCKEGNTRPQGWNENNILTEFIFLQGGATPKLAPNFTKFIDDAKEAKEPLVVMSFSSMPIPREDIMKMTVKMVEECGTKPRVIALIGKRDISKEPLSSALKKKSDVLIKEGKILEAAGAPFSVLFGFMDCIIMHGGLGTTAEAMRCGVPVICTGVLLMDQRFWGQQIENLGIGPAPVHISMFSNVCVKHIDNALKEDSEWKVAAEKLAAQIQPKESEDGVKENITAIQEMVEKNKIFKYPYIAKD